MKIIKLMDTLTLGIFAKLTLKLIRMKSMMGFYNEVVKNIVYQENG